jgi:hypothetical protein
LLYILKYLVWGAQLTLAVNISSVKLPSSAFFKARRARLERCEVESLPRYYVALGTRGIAALTNRNIPIIRFSPAFHDTTQSAAATTSVWEGTTSNILGTKLIVSRYESI